MSVNVPPEWGRPGVSPMGAMRSADRTFLQNTLTAVEQLVRNTAYGRPRGYEAAATWVFDPPTSQTRLSEYQFGLSMWCPTIKRAVDGSPAVVINFNPNPQRWSEGDRPMLDERGDRLYTQRLSTQALFGSTATFDGRYVLYTSGDESPTLPVSREEFLRALIFTLERDAKTGALKTSGYQEWMAQAGARKKARDETIAVIATRNPAQAAELQRTLEQAERAQTEQLRALDAQYPVARLGDRYRTQLAAMTPAERASPALVHGLDLVPASAPSPHPVVRENPAFYRARRSPTEPRAALVFMPLPYKPLEALYRQAYGEFDWAAVKKLVNAQP